MKAAYAYIQRRHVERLREAAYPDLREPELARAWRSLQLHWLASVPEYREEVRAKIASAIAEQNAGRVVCIECGGELIPSRFTLGCQHCIDRRRKLRDRTRQARNEERLERLTGY